MDKTNSVDGKTFNFDYTKISNIEFDGIDHDDYPDYCDAHIVSAEYDGREMTEDEIEALNNDSSFVYERLMDSLL
jgi:hypothetical protein